MGKSVKKTPMTKENSRGSNKHRKAIANRQIRRKLNRDKESVKGSTYKKMYESWNISDYTFRMTKEDAIKDYYRWLRWDEENGFTTTKTRFPTLEDFLNWWEKTYMRK